MFPSGVSGVKKTTLNKCYCFSTSAGWVNRQLLTNPFKLPHQFKKMFMLCFCLTLLTPKNPATATVQDTVVYMSMLADSRHLSNTKWHVCFYVTHTMQCCSCYIIIIMCCPRIMSHSTDSVSIQSVTYNQSQQPIDCAHWFTETGPTPWTSPHRW